MASKRQKKTQVRGRDARTDVIDAALRLAALRAWDRVTLADIAEEAGISLAALAQMFTCREDIVTAYARRVDADALSGISGEGSERDRLFDAVMQRLERLNRDRAAVVSILHGAMTDPRLAVVTLPHIARSMLWMLEACGIETQGMKGAARIAGLSAVYLWTLRTWRGDESADLGKTMATLDGALARAESLAGMVGL
ncbi:MAG: TetR family transcriptional regulator [Rhodospirillales bacterium]|nr:TetR family transcriptional regulator [Alphaproteobacteria bacterium]MCB9987297.1 TetR family transcriptional regulator [Rhodospirillales bacterium]USO07846.1 MAG: TetR family transcriptional regulator [Rhodospirillales bacterium]